MPDPLGSFRDQLVHGVGGERGRRRRRTVVVGGVAAVLAIGVGVVAVAALPRDGGNEQVVAGASTTTTTAPDGCAITVSPEPGFSAPDGWPAHPPEGVWYGTARLWTQLPSDGSSPTPRKSVWWSADFPGGGEEPAPEIAVTWRRLDDPAAPQVQAEPPGTNAHTAEHGWFMIAGIDPEGFGCWEVTATYKGNELGYVFWNPPRVWSHPGPVADGMDALLQGQVQFDAEHNCYLVDNYPVVWPYGTTASSDGATLTIGDGTVVRVGDRVSGGGGIVEATWLEHYGIPPDCLPPTKDVMQFNAGSEIEVTP